MAVAILFPVAATLVFVQQFESAWQLRLGDSDNYMRLVEVRDLLGGQNWFDLVQSRVDPPRGLHSHWSRLADLPYALPMLLLGSFLPTELAERLTVVIVPPLLLLLTMVVIARLADRMAGWRGAVCACVLLAVSPSILAQFAPGRIDHHGLQILLLAVAASAALGRETASSGVSTALASALALAVGLETAPYLAAIAAWLAARWVVRGVEARTNAVGYFVGIGVVMPLLIATTLPSDEWLNHRYDALGAGHLFTVVAGAVAFTLAILAAGSGGLKHRLTYAAAAAAATLTVAVQFPDLISDPYREMDPVMRRIWNDRLGETQTFVDYWRQGPAIALGRIWFVAAAAATAMFLAVRSRNAQRQRFILLALLALVGLVLTFWQVRATASATIVGILIAATLLASLWEGWQRGRNGVLSFAAATFLLNPVIVFAFGSLAGSVGSERGMSMADVALRQNRCDEPAGFDLLARQPRGLVVNPIDQSATILARTPHFVISAPNHRNAAANARVYRAFAAPPDRAEAHVRALRADYVVYCPDAIEVANIASVAPEGLLAQLRANRLPAWLEPVTPRNHGELVVLRRRLSQ